MSAESFPRSLRTSMYDKMVLIRKFEESIVRLCRGDGKVVGMQILAVGQEAVAVGVVEALKTDDVIVSNHRSHGHLLARGADPDRLMAEIMTKETGVNKGKAGTLHLSVPEANAILTSTVVGAGPPLAAGAAFAQQYRGEGSITVVFFGDGAAAEGSVHEAMNLAALWKLPLLFVCENNSWAGAQKLSQHSSVEDLARRAAGYGMPGESVDGNDVEAVYAVAAEFASGCRAGEGPAFLEAKTYRMRGHGERDHQHYVDKRELATWSERCPIKRQRERLLHERLASASELERIDSASAARVERAVQYAEKSPYPAAEEALHDLWVE
jgi:TPP-dependent pyruvate/acetoin dehydrogenase alpha subunit